MGKEVVNPIFAFIPGLGAWTLSNLIPELQKKAGVEGGDEQLVDFLSFFMCAPYGVFRLQGKLNEVWEK